jgi:hypothetical protein
MTGVGMYGVFIPDRFRQAGRGTNRKVSNRLGVGMLGWGGEVSMSVVCAGGITVLIRWSSFFPSDCVAMVSRIY